MTAVGPAKMHADEVEISDDLVRELLHLQFPHWADLPLHRMPSTGTDNAIYRLGPDLGIRLPRIHWAVKQVNKEHQWLPRLAPQVPAAVPAPTGLGRPAHGYPYEWLVYEWLHAEDALVAVVDDWCELAREVAVFVRALQRVDPVNGPAPTARLSSLAAQDEGTRRAIGALADEIDVGRALAVWEAALAADPWPGAPVWAHGDLLPGNLLVQGGRLVGIIDWSAAGVGDPACDAMLAWALPPAARVVYRDELGYDDATWARARGWVVEQTAHFIPYYAETIPVAVAAARRRLNAALADPSD